MKNKTTKRKVKVEELKTTKMCLEMQVPTEIADDAFKSYMDGKVEAAALDYIIQYAMEKALEETLKEVSSGKLSKKKKTNGKVSN